MRLRSAAVIAALSLPLACSRGAGDDAERLRARPAAIPPPAFDWAHPAAALDLGADEIAARLGSFEWSAAVEWTVSRDGDEAQRVRAVERHRVRQAATGEFEVQAEIDPGLGAGSDTGKDIVWAGGMTYARARYAPFRERPTDHGRDARRFRDESFQIARSLARLLGAALELRPAGDAEALHRPARKLLVTLAKEAAEPAATAEPAPVIPDEDTKRRRAFLAGLRPQSAKGELLLDAATGAPLEVRLAVAFGVAGDPKARATVELLAQVKALGAEAAAVVVPKGALPDERKAAGVAAALEAAGLKKRPEEKGSAEPAEDAGEE